jgi:diacylglycerol kinase family enzyme
VDVLQRIMTILDPPPPPPESPKPEIGFRFCRRGGSIRGMQRDWVLIGNPQAGAGRALKAWLRLAGRFPEISSLSVRWTRAGGEAIDLARNAAGKCEMVVAVGGDGTVNEVATGLLEAAAGETALGILPLGTGNDAARALGLADPVAAWKALVRGRTRVMDVLEVRCGVGDRAKTRYSLVYAAAGIAVEILERTTPRVKWWVGRRGCYTVGFLRTLIRRTPGGLSPTRAAGGPSYHEAGSTFAKIFGWRSPKMRVRCNGHEYAGRFLLVSAGNAEWVGGGMMRLSPGARWDDGLLNVNLIPEMGWWRALRNFPRLYRGTHLEVKGVQYLTAEELELAAEPQTRVQVDGDVCGETPVRFRVLPGRLRVRQARL